jgi:hypothetical protein
MRKKTGVHPSPRISGALKAIFLALPVAATSQTVQKKLEFIPNIGGFQSMAIYAVNIGSTDTIRILDWKLGDPAPDSILLPESLNDSFDLEIDRKNLGGRTESDSFRYSTGKNGVLPR